MHKSNPITRRHFLRGSAAMAAAGLAVPHFAISRAYAAGATPNEQIRIGFIGMGRQAGDLLKNLVTLPQARVVAVADVNLPRAEAVAAVHKAKAYQDYRRLLENKDVDAIITATPEHWRALICVAACQAGKDLYVEKPMSLTVKEGRLIVQAVRKYNRVFQTGSQQRSMIRNHIGCEFIRKGGLGKISRVIAHNYPSPWEGALPAQTIPNGLDWEMWCGPAPKVPYNKDLYLPRANPGWLSFRPYSGGEMTGWGSHGFDQVQCALGMDLTGPTEIWTEGPAWETLTYTAAEAKIRGDKQCSQPKVFFRYPGDIIMELGDGPEGGAIFIGEKGKVTINRGVCESEPDDLLQETIRNRPKGMSENHLKNWLDCVKSREKPIADVEIGHRSATVCHLGNIGRQLGRKLKWDPEKEIFPEDKEANQYLEREHRKGYELPSQV